MSDFARAVMARLTEMERRQAGMEIRGKVAAVDPEKALAKIEIGEDEDGTPVLSPWVPYAQKAGALKLHSAPSVGEPMVIRSESGDIQQGTLYPHHWSDENPAPSQDGDIHKLVFGDVTVTLSGSGITLVAGGVTFVFDGDGFRQEGGEQSHDGKNVGSTHIHPESIGSVTGPPG